MSSKRNHASRSGMSYHNTKTGMLLMNQRSLQKTNAIKRIKEAKQKNASGGSAS